MGGVRRLSLVNQSQGHIDDDPNPDSSGANLTSFLRAVGPHMLQRLSVDEDILGVGRRALQTLYADLLASVDVCVLSGGKKLSRLCAGNSGDDS